MQTSTQASTPLAQAHRHPPPSAWRRHMAAVRGALAALACCASLLAAPAPAQAQARRATRSTPTT